MKRSALSFIFSVLLSPAFLFSQDSPKERALVKTNRIKSKTAYELKFSLGDKKDSALLYSKKYDPKGNLTENSSPAEKTVYQYNDKGKLIEEISYYPDNSVLYKDVYTYDVNGCNIEKTELESSEKTAFRISSKFNDKKLETEKSILSAGGNVQSKQQFSYDDEGNKVSETNLDSAGNEMSRKVTMFDAKNNITAVTQSKKDSITAKYVYEYNAAGKKTKTICYNADGSINFKTTYLYDAKSGSVNEEINYQGSSITKAAYKYNEKGNVIQDVKTNDDGTLLTKFTYAYDDKNLIRQETEFSSFDEPQSAFKYFYEFYPTVKENPVSKKGKPAKGKK